MKEQRRHKRCRHTLETKCQQADKDMFVAKCLDISASGLKLITDKNLSPDEVLNLEMVLEKRYPAVKLKGKIARQKPYIDKFKPKEGEIEYGIRFVEIDNPTMRRIFNFIANIEKERLTKTREVHTMTDMPF